MTQERLWIALVCAVAAAGGDAAVAHEAQSSSASQARREPLVLTGRVTEIHAPRLFTIRKTDDGRDMVVLAPRALSPSLAGATVRVEGTLRRLEAGELTRTVGRLDDRTRARVTGRTVLVATSFIGAVEGGEPVPPAAVSQEPPAPPPPPAPAEAAHATSPAPLIIRASTLVANLEGFAGQRLRIMNARVVGLLAPGAFLVEPATEYLKDLGTRDRIVVFIEGGGALRVPADLVVGEKVTVEGVARTLLGVRVGEEVPWPERLTREEVKRLEVRAAVLATSVRTAEGTELTDRPAGTSGS